jgi:hypothetical protein
MPSPGYIQFRMRIQSGQSQQEKSPEDAGQLKNLPFRLVSRNSFSLGLSSVRLSTLDVCCPGDKGRGSNLTQAARAAMRIDARDVVSQTFCMKVKIRIDGRLRNLARRK